MAGRQHAGFGREPARDAPPPPDPPHGKDSRFWIDVTRIISVPGGQMPLMGQADWAEFMVAVAWPARLRLVLADECCGVRSWG